VDPHYLLPNLNSFLEDTSVIVALAFLIVRGRALNLFRRERPYPVVLGVILGAVACTELLFPGERMPYRMHSLILGFASLECGFETALLAMFVFQAALMFANWSSQPLREVVEALIVVCVTLGLKPVLTQRTRWARLTLVPLAAQLCAVVPLMPSWSELGHGANPLFSVVANYFAVLLLVLVVEDARERSNAHRWRLESAERVALANAAKLQVLRSKINPHFLFNSLNTIASLCMIDSHRAAKTVSRLALLMRRVVDQEFDRPVSLAQELDFVEAYIAIQRERFGKRLKWQTRIGDPDVLVPPLSVQLLVENAVVHGLAGKAGGGTVSVTSRTSGRRTLIAIADDGVGLGSWKPDPSASHGMSILNQQLVLTFGPESRLRVLSRVGMGTIIAFSIPVRESK